MKIEIRTNEERQEILRALRLADKFVLPDVADLTRIKEQLVKLKF